MTGDIRLLDRRAFWGSAAAGEIVARYGAQWAKCCKNCNNPGSRSSAMANCCQKCSISASLSESAAKFLHFVQHCTRTAGFTGISVANHATLVGQELGQSLTKGVLQSGGSGTEVGQPGQSQAKAGLHTGNNRAKAGSSYCELSYCTAPAHHPSAKEAAPD